jgi:hypothetical protein
MNRVRVVVITTLSKGLAAAPSRSPTPQAEPPRLTRHSCRALPAGFIVELEDLVPEA